MPTASNDRELGSGTGAGPESVAKTWLDASIKKMGVTTDFIDVILFSFSNYAFNLQ